MKPKYYIYPNKKPEDITGIMVIVVDPVSGIEKIDIFGVADKWYGEFLWRYA